MLPTSSFLSSRLVKRVNVRSFATGVQAQCDGLKIDLRGKKVFVAGVADSTGYGWAIAKACAEAGATILVGTWTPMMPSFQTAISSGKYDNDSVLSNGSKMNFDKVSS